VPAEDRAVPDSPTVPLSGLPALMERIEAEATRVSETLWSAEDEARVETIYEQAAILALRAPLLAERSVALRRIAKRVLPKALVPAARRAVGAVDGLSRRVVGAKSSRRRPS
jgi:predicted component of type VI protein secretion system